MSSDSESSDDDYYGPALPPGFKQTPTPASNEPQVSQPKPSESSTIGPVLPPEIRAKLESTSGDNESDKTLEKNEKDSSTSQAKTGQEGGAESESDSDSEVIGPLPPDHPKAQRRAASSLPSSSESKKPKREEWMLVPPKNRIIPGLGLGPRKFLTRAPEDSHRSDEEEDEEEMFAREAEEAIAKKLIDDYDQKMDDLKKDFETKKKRGQSLLEIHQKDLKEKKNEKADEKAERKPFDRDNDLKITGLSGDDKQKYIEKSKELNTKFSRGSRKYL